MLMIRMTDMYVLRMYDIYSTAKCVWFIDYVNISRNVPLLHINLVVSRKSERRDDCNDTKTQRQ